MSNNQFEPSVYDKALVNGISYGSSFFRQKKVLDIGTGKGQIARLIKEKGAEVFVCEPDLDSLTQAIESGNVEASRSYQLKAQELPENLHGQFDVITVFKFNVDYNEFNEFFKKLPLLLKPSGTVFIHFADQEYCQDKSVFQQLLKICTLKVYAQVG